MSKATMPIERAHSQRWTLSADQRIVRQQLPPINLPGVAKPVLVHLYFDAQAVDALLERLSVLRSQMQPAPQRN